jgi:hypothetical protein
VAGVAEFRRFIGLDQDLGETARVQ